MTFEERLDHLRRSREQGISFEEPKSVPAYRKPKPYQAPKMFTVAEKSWYVRRLRADHKPR